jgi:hypothetical protein
MGRPSASARAWQRSGLAELTGRPDGPALLAPDGVVDRIKALGKQAGVDALALAAERAGYLDLTRRGATSAGGSTRLLPAADGWLAVSLARPDDVVAVPAWLEVDADVVAAEDPWPAVVATVADRPTAGLVGRATLLSLPVSAVGEHERAGHGPAVATEVGGAAPFRRRAPVVLDLSSLWAGPLCGRILADAGARVTKVESVARPDGARAGDPAFFDLLNGAKEQVSLDFGTEDGRAELLRLVAQAEVVIEASRPRALAALGIDATTALRADVGPQVWVSITGHGRDQNRVAFGDDGAAAGGLVAWDEAGPCFVADAIADPLAGITAAGVVRTAMQAGGRWLVDVSLAGVAAHVQGDERGLWAPVPG